MISLSVCKTVNINKWNEEWLTEIKQSDDQDDTWQIATIAEFLCVLDSFIKTEFTHSNDPFFFNLD